MQGTDQIIVILQLWSVKFPFIARLLELLDSFGGLSVVTTFVSFLGGFGVKAGLAAYSKLSRWARLNLFLRPRRFSMIFSCIPVRGTVEATPEQIRAVKDLSILADFYCLIIRYGLDSYLRDVATPAEMEDAQRQLKIVPCAVSTTSNGDLELKFDIRIHQSLGTQFKCYAQTRLLKPWNTRWPLLPCLRRFYEWIWFRTHTDETMQAIMAENERRVRSLHTALLAAEFFGCISNVSRSRSTYQEKFYFIVEKWAAAPSVEERVKYNPDTDTFERAARVLNNYIYPT